MPKIQVSKVIHRPAQEAYQTLKAQFERGDEGAFASLGQEKPAITWHDGERKGVFSNGKIDGAFFISDENPCTLHIEIKLPMMLTPLKGMIEKGLKKHLETIQ